MSDYKEQPHQAYEDEGTPEERTLTQNEMENSNTALLPAHDGLEESRGGSALGKIAGLNVESSADINDEKDETGAQSAQLNEQSAVSLPKPAMQLGSADLGRGQGIREAADVGRPIEELEKRSAIELADMKKGDEQGASLLQEQSKTGEAKENQNDEGDRTNSKLQKRSMDSRSEPNAASKTGNKIAPILQNTGGAELPDIASSSTKFKPELLIELSQENVDKLPNALEHVDHDSLGRDARSPRAAGLTDMHMVPQTMPPISNGTAVADFSKPERKDSQGNDSKKTDITKNPIPQSIASTQKRKADRTRLLSRLDSEAAQSFTHAPRKELGGFSYHELQQTDGKTKVKSIQTATIIKELRKLNQRKMKGEDIGSSSSEEENATQGNKRERKYESFDPGAENQERNKQVFRKSYGMDINLPTYYIQDAKVYPKNLNFVLKAVKYILPEDGEYMVREIKKQPKMEEEEEMETVVEEKQISQSYAGDKFCPNNCVLQLMKQEGENLHVTYEVPIVDSRKVDIAFSPDGLWFSLFRVKLNKLSIFKVDDYDIEGLMRKVETGEYYKEYDGDPKLVAVTDRGHNEIRQRFDSNSRFLALFCQHKVTIINLAAETNIIEDKDHFQIHETHPKMFVNIIDLTLVSTSQTQYRCDVAARQTDKYNVVLFDIQSEEPAKSKRQINYEHHVDKKNKNHNTICKISNDFQKAILSVGSENYLLTKDEDDATGDGTYTQKTIGWIKDKKVTFVVAVKNDFIFVCHKDYDQNLDIEASFSENFKIMVDRNIEPGILKVLDVAQENLDEDGFGDRMVIINTKQERFYYDAINPQAKNRDLTSRNASEDGTPNHQADRGLDVDLTNFGTAVISDTLVDKTEIKDNDRCIIGSYEYTPSGSHCVMWPYMTMAGIQDTVWVYCAFYDPPVLVRLVPPHEHGTFRIAQTYMTEAFDLYYLIENIKDQKFELWYTDLDNPDCFTDFKDQKFEMERIFEYTMEDIEEPQCTDMFVRSPSSKNATGNKKLFAFFQHKTVLYCWIHGRTGLERVGETDSLCLTKLNPNEFVIRQDQEIQGQNGQKQKVFTLKKVKAQYSMYSISNLYVELEPLHVKAYSFDSFSNMVTIMFKDKPKNGVINNRFKIYCLATQSVKINFLVNDPEIIGRFVSEMYTLIKGHYYFNNKVYKIRYDLFDQVQTRPLTQEEAFDKYEELLDLKHGEQVIANTPLVSLELHKMAYFTRNQKFYKPNRMIILPYLHERKIYLNKMKPSNKYFYTTLKRKFLDEDDDETSHLLSSLGHDYVEDSHQADHEIVCLDVTAQKFFIYDEGGRLTLRHEFGKQMEEGGYGTIVEASNNGRIFIFADEKNKPGIMHIFALQRSGFHLMRTINIHEAIKAYATANIQHQTNEEERIEAWKLHKALHGEYAPYFFGSNSKYEYAINDRMDFTVQISSKQETDLENELNTTFPQKEQQSIIALIKTEIALNKTDAYNKEGLRELKRRRDRIRSNLSNATKEILDSMPTEYKLQILERLANTRVSIFYIERAKKLINKSQIIGQSAIRRSNTQSLTARPGSLLGSMFEDDEKVATQEVFITKSQDIFDNFTAGDFTMNKDYVFFWNNYRVWYYNLNEISFETRQTFHPVDLNVDKRDRDSWIKLVRAGSEMDQISIRVRQAPGLDCFIIWDVVKDMEIYCSDCSHNAQQIFDSKGQAYIIGDEQDSPIQQGVTICEQGVTLKCYEVDGFNSKYNRERNKMASTYGFKFDERHHNWILCNEYLGLSFSFMTLVIRDREQKNDDHSEYMFDKDQYNFVMNKRTFLTAELSFVQNHEELEYVLAKLKSIDPNLLEQLHYYYKLDLEDGQALMHSLRGDAVEQIEDEDIIGLAPINTPLHLAQTNNRSVNIILKYMSDIPYNASQNFKDLLHLFVDNPSFKTYMANLPFQTIQMQKKYTLQVSEKYNEHIVSVKGSPCMYVDNFYFEKYMHEDKKNTSYDNYPVKMTALRMQWIFENEGKLLLEAVLNSSDLSLYDNRTMVVIIEFLYQYYRKTVLKVQLPIYFVQLIIFYTAVTVPLHPESAEASAASQCTSKSTHCSSAFVQYVRDATAILNLISSLYTLALIGLNTYLIPQTYFKSQWAYFELVYFILNFIISIGLISTNRNWFDADEQVVSTALQRQAIAFLSVVICSKSLYFMQIIDRIANIVTVIFLIFRDIFWFVIIFIIFMFSFALSFYQLGQNQVEFDVPGWTQSQLANNNVNYLTIMGGLSHVFQIALGQFNIDAYSVAEGTRQPTQETILYIFWVLTIFMLMIHLLNFLIAIMGQTFSDNNDVKDKDTLRSHLRFVLSNWWMNPIPDKQRTQYLMTAFLKVDDDDDGGTLGEVQEQIDEIKEYLKYEVNAKLFKLSQEY